MQIEHTTTIEHDGTVTTTWPRLDIIVRIERVQEQAMVQALVRLVERPRRSGGKESTT